MINFFGRKELSFSGSQLSFSSPRSICLEVFFKKDIAKSFTKFTGKYLWRGLFLRKLDLSRGECFRSLETIYWKAGFPPMRTFKRGIFHGEHKSEVKRHQRDSNPQPLSS